MTFKKEIADKSKRSSFYYLSKITAEELKLDKSDKNNKNMSKQLTYDLSLNNENGGTKIKIKDSK